VHGRRGSHGHHRRTRRRSAPVAGQKVSHAAAAGARENESELFGVRLRAQAGVDSATAQQQNLLERRPELAIEPRVDDRIEETVGVAEPEEQRGQPVRDALVRLVAERFYERQYEERQPAGGDEDTAVYVVVANE